MDAKEKVETPLKVSTYRDIAECGPALARRALAELRIIPGT